VAGFKIMSELNTTPAPTPETDKATVTTDWMTGKPVVPADFARRLERERDKAREREKSLLLRLGQEKDHSEHVMARLNDSDTLRLAMFADLRREVEQQQSVISATRQTATDAMNEIRLAAGAPMSQDDKSQKRAVDYVADLRRDRERLDWLEDKLCYAMVCLNGRSMESLPNNGKGWHNGELRAAIDAARAKDAKTEGGV
jgi:hypothetical protein